MDEHKAKTLALMGARRVPVSLVEPLTKHFVGDKKYLGLDANTLLDKPDEMVDKCGVSMNLNSMVVDFDVDGPPEWQRAFAMAMESVIGPVAFSGAFKRESLDYPSHYLFSSDVIDVVRDVVKIKSAYPVNRYQSSLPMDDHVAVEMRTAIDTPSNEKLHTVLPGSVYPRKDNPDETERLVWVSDGELRLPECPNEGTMRRVLFTAATLYLIGTHMDEGVILGEDKFGRHSAYLVYCGWLRRMVYNNPESMPFATEAETKNFCENLIRQLCLFSEDDEKGDRLGVVASTFRIDVESLPGNISFMDTFRALYSNTPKVMTDLAETLGAPPRPRELDALLMSTLFDATYGQDAMYVQVGNNPMWNAPPKRFNYMKKAKLDARYNSFLIPFGDKMVPVSKVFQISQELRVIEEKEFNRHVEPGHLTVMGVDEASKRQLVKINTFMGHPFETRPNKIDPEHWIIRWFELSAKLLTQSDEEARWLINRIAMIFRNPETHPRTMPVLIGEEATGKSRFADMIAQVVGLQYCHQLGTKDLRQADSFTGFLEDKIFIYATEVDLTDMNTQDRLKSWSSDNMIDMQGKGKEATTIPNPIRLMMLLTNKDELQALNQFSETEDTRMALFRARSKTEMEEERNEAIKCYDKYENAIVRANKGDPSVALDALRHLRWFLDTGETPFCVDTYDQDALLVPPDTEDRKRLRATQVPKDMRFAIEIVNEPAIIQLLAAALKEGQIEHFTGVEVLWVSRAEFRNAIHRIAEKKGKRGGAMLGFVNSPAGGFGKSVKKILEEFVDEEITTPRFSSKKQDGKKFKVYKFPPYRYMMEYIKVRYGEEAAEVFEWEELCENRGFIEQEIGQAELFASMGLSDDF